MDAYNEALDKATQAAVSVSTAKERVHSAQQDLVGLHKLLDVRRGEEAELQQSVPQATLEFERAKQAQKNRMQVIEERRQQALVQHKQLQARRAEERKNLQAFQAQRLKLEDEVLAVKRSHEQTLANLRARQQALLDGGEAYVRTLGALLLRNGEERASVSLRGRPPLVGGRPPSTPMCYRSQ